LKLPERPEAAAWSLQNRAGETPATEVAMPLSLAEPLNLAEFDPNRLAAVVYRPQDDVDTLLAGFAHDLLRAGERLGGVVQRNDKDERGKLVGMQLVDLMTGRQIGIYQKLGEGSAACKLDSSGLAEATRSISNAIEGQVSLLIVNKFSKQEAAGGGLRDELADAVLAGLPVLVGVPEKCLDAWKMFTGDRGTTLFCARRVVDGWWEELARREAILRGAFIPAAPCHPAELSAHR
jgi:molybdate transport system ATP-binding protein